jgi:hypothetical protein
MAGRKQHYLPVSLLRGFSTLIDRAEKVELFRLGAAGIAVSIRDVAHSRDFYSSPADSRLDDSITHYEGAAFAPTLAKLRAATTIDPSLVAAAFELVAHLSIRTESIRKVGSAVIRGVATKVGPQVTEPSFIEREIERFMDPATGNIEKMIADSAREGGVALSPEQIVSFAALARTQMQGRRDEALRFVQPAMQYGIQKLTESADDIAAKGHKKALSQSLSPEERQQDLREFSPTIIVAGQGERFILGDSAVVGIDGDGAARSALADYDRLVVIVLPIANDRAIALMKPGASEQWAKPEVANSAAAALASRFFVATPGTGAARYSELIGTRANPLEDISDDKS